MNTRITTRQRFRGGVSVSSQFVPPRRVANARRLRVLTLGALGAYALLGQGRCLTVLGKHDEAQTSLREARELFASMGYQPALAETQSLLDQHEVAAS